MIEVWVTAKLTDEQYATLCALARRRYPEAVNDGWPSNVLVPNLLRDLMPSNR